MAAPSDAVIDIEGLWTVFGKGASATTVHQDLNLRVERGEMLSLVGGSGTGKTVLLRQILGLMQPTRGRVTSLGRPAVEMCGPGAASRVGMLFQHGALFSAFSVQDNIAFALRELRTLPADLIYDVAMVKLQMVGLDVSAACKMPSDLSGGMIKRVALARALSLEPELVFLDEPTAGLDPRASDDYVALIRELRRELGLTVVMVTHDLDTLVALSDRIAVLADRKVLAAQPIEQIIQIDHPFIKEYFLGERGKRALMALGPQMTEAVAAATLAVQED